MPSRPRARCIHCGVEAVRGKIWHLWNCKLSPHKLEHRDYQALGERLHREQEALLTQPEVPSNAESSS